jgi:lipopolysaccharide biosynthesis glycosyltransferase
MLRSVIDNLEDGRALNIYVIASYIDEAGRQGVSRGWPPTVTVTWLEAEETAFAGLPLWGRMPVATYFKLGLTELLPADVSRAIWLDCDLIVLDDIGNLWDTELEGAPLGAVQDSLVPRVSSTFGIARHRELGIDSGSMYFNAGVMIVDVEAWRRAGVTSQAIEYLRKYQDAVTFWDQEGLNATLAGNWLALDGRWNHNASIPRNKLSSELPSIAHFAGGLKPWRFRTRDPLRSLYYVYLDRTSFAGWRPEPSMAGEVVSFYERSGLRSLMYPAENLGMRMVRGLSRRVSPNRPALSANPRN